VTGCEQGSEYSGSIKGGEFLNYRSFSRVLAACRLRISAGFPVIPTEALLHFFSVSPDEF
jgi:hypothetical protein